MLGIIVAFDERKVCVRSRSCLVLPPSEDWNQRILLFGLKMGCCLFECFQRHSVRIIGCLTMRGYRKHSQRCDVRLYAGVSLMQGSVNIKL